ncbi:hypothetical protein ABK040_015478 [Willaertia magna]
MSTTTLAPTIFNELNTFLQLPNKFIPEPSTTILIKDSTNSMDGTFLTHHFINSYFQPNNNNTTSTITTNQVILCSFYQTFFHYQSVSLKLNLNLEKLNNFNFIDAQLGNIYLEEEGDDLLSIHSPLIITKLQNLNLNNNNITIFKNKEENLENYLKNLLNLILKLKKNEMNQHCIILDQLQYLFYYFQNNNNFKKLILNFIHELKKENFTILLHVYQENNLKNNLNEQNNELNNFINLLEYLSEIIYNVGPLPTGYSKDVHGRLECKVVVGNNSTALKNVTTTMMDKKVVLHYKLFESKVALFLPGQVASSGSDLFLI